MDNTIQKPIYSVVAFRPVYGTDERGNVVIARNDKMVYYKDNKFFLGYHSDRKVWKTIRGAEKAVLALKSRYFFNMYNSTYGIEDNNGNLVEWYDKETNKFYKE